MPAPVYNMNPQQQPGAPQNGAQSYQDSKPGQAPVFEAYDDPDDHKQPEKKTVTILGHNMNRDLLVSKLFYLFFYSAFGSLFPLIAIYFKQLGMNATQAGLLIGLRPFVEFASIPFWSTFADKFRQGKKLLIFTLICWIVSTVMLNQIKPETMYCLYNENGTIKMENVKLVQETAERAGDYVKNEKIKPVTRYYGPKEDEPPPGIAPLPLTDKVVGYRPSENTDQLVHPPFSTRVYYESNVQEGFVLLLLIIMIGEFASSPATSIADACTVQYLKEDPNEIYAKQRMWGSVGWAVMMFFIGMILQGAAPPEDEQQCKGLEAHEKNYTVCFTAFAILMLCAVIVSFFFTFPSDEGTRADEVAGMLMDVNNRRIDTAVAQQARDEGPKDSGGGDDASAVPSWIGVLKTFSSPHHLAFLAVTFWMGMGVGLVFTFLFWHLQDIGGGPNLYGFASVINHVSEVCAYFFAVDLINKFGHIKVLYIGLFANCLRFLYVSLIPGAWFVLPVEFIQGLTHATVWSACSSYISLACPPEQKAIAQQMLSSLHHAVGRGVGAILGGLIITYFGTRVCFIGYSVGSLLLLVCFFLLNRIFKVAHDSGAGTTTADTMGATALEPHGMPMTVPFQKSDNKQQYNNLPQEPVNDPTQDAYDKYVAGG